MKNDVAAVPDISVVVSGVSSIRAMIGMNALDPPKPAIAPAIRLRVIKIRNVSIIYYFVLFI